MLSEELFSSVCGPPVAANTAISKDIGIYSQSLTPSYAVKASFKKSSCPRHGLAVSLTHIFAAQDQKAHVHVYSRTRGNQEALVSFPERIRSLALAGNVLIVGTTEGRLMIWEVSIRQIAFFLFHGLVTFHAAILLRRAQTNIWVQTCTGRQLSTPPCHVQPVSCVAVTAYHVISGSDDSNINVWSLARLLDFDDQSEAEPEVVLSNHRGAVTDLVAGPGANPETSICVSASKDKTCIIWNYRTGQLLRTLLFPTPLVALSLDPAARAIFVTAEGGAVFLAELYGEKPLLGVRAAEPPSIVVQINEPLAPADEEAGEINCAAGNHDGTSFLTGHRSGRILRWTLAPNAPPTQLANLNASVTNIIFSPLLPEHKSVKPHTIVKPNQAQRQHVFTAQLKGAHSLSRFSELLDAQGFPPSTLEEVAASFATSGQQGTDGDEGTFFVPTDLRTSMKDSMFRTSLGT